MYWLAEGRRGLEPEGLRSALAWGIEASGYKMVASTTPASTTPEDEEDAVKPLAGATAAGGLHVEACLPNLLLEFRR